MADDPAPTVGEREKRAQNSLDSMSGALRVSLWASLPNYKTEIHSFIQPTNICPVLTILQVPCYTSHKMAMVQAPDSFGKGQI